MLHSALPHFPDAPALRVLLSQLTHYTTSFVRLGFGFRTHLPPLLEDAVSARVSSEFSRAVEDLVRTSGMGWYAVGVPLEVPRGTAAGVLHMPSRVLVVYPPMRYLPMRSSQHQMGCGCWRQRLCRVTLRGRSMPR
jgi:hypothetical protein